MSNVTTLTQRKLSFPTDQARAFVRAATCAIGAAAKDEVRGDICWIRVEQFEDRIEFQSTDSYRANHITFWVSDPLPSEVYFVDAKELARSLPKQTAFPKRGTERLEYEFEPGRAELDAGVLHLYWNASSVNLYAPRKLGREWPDMLGLFNRNTENEHTGEPVGYNPDFLGQISKEAKLVHKDKPVTVTTGHTPLQASLFTTSGDWITYRSLLMPVRVS